MNRVARRQAAQRAATRDHAVVHRVAALLLDYPTADLLESLPRLRAVVRVLGDRSAHLRVPLEGVLDHLEQHALTELEAEYVRTFDLARRRSLYLTYYAYGDTRKRGVALVEFKQAFSAAGFELAADELPDHLAVVLEFGATGDAAAQESALRLLLAHRAGLEVLRLALQDAGSPYAGAVVAVCATLPPLAGPDREAVARLAAQGPPGEEVGLEPFAPPSYMPTTGARR
ncbi:nitrate reductase molybdenum cofactor assembly chaperone [Cellulomonas sp. ATA003]|uniref:nitrate reductase molybdenum cofactor assembly chaperone n=1 Tax=Cellulomonas sp. ATA003 TaxID=3073064 RepID=UPI002873351D|nr:nitrate reductase molybdenum cofactor assembly chaperone [Cellulomonas sp. ATA003]WNB87251.1 nitrate reductase molybdenum cofactor assembly chaperone [Cellulomonas sp. ATA003]